MPGDAVRTEQDSFETQLNPAECSAGAVSRKAAFYVLVAASVVACAAAAYFWFLWVVTARTCIDTYILRSTTSALLDPSKANSLQDYLSGLDISSFSALILALLCTRLAVAGLRHTMLVRHRAGKGFFTHAYHRVLFPEGFESLCIRLGLLGTLLSFLLAAISLMGNVSLPTSDVNTGTLEGRAAALSLEAAPDDTSPDVIAAPQSRNPSTGQLSGQMFLLLCASLVSTFVGTAASYLVTPSLNWLHGRAMGQHQLRQIDEEMVAEQFFRQIDRTSQRLVQFESTTVALAESTRHIAAFGDNVSSASERLYALVDKLERSMRIIEVANQNGQKLAKRLENVERLDNRLSILLQRLPQQLETSLADISSAAARFRDAADVGQDALGELKRTASSVGDSLQRTEQQTHESLQLLADVQKAVHDLSGRDRLKTEGLRQLARSFQQLSSMLRESSTEVDALLKQSGDGDGKDLAADRSPERAQKQPELAEGAGGDGRTSHRPTRSASWWRRLFG